jgi:hypothetical protein
MSPYLYRRLMREKLAQLRRHAGARLSHAQSAHKASMLALNPVPAKPPRLRAVERNPVGTTPTAYRELNQRTADGRRLRSNGTQRPTHCASWSWIARAQL